jgi:MFS transporter, DHA1 family, tetracycline resistance protein
MGFDLIRGRSGMMLAVMCISSAGFGMQVPVLPLYLRSLGVSAQVIGFILGTFGAALIVFEFGWGWWSDRVGIGIPLIITRTGTSVVLFGYGAFQAVPAFFLLQFLAGAFQCASGPLSWSYFGHAVPVARRGEAIGLSQMATALGTGVGALAGGFIAQWTGYRTELLVAGGVASVSALLALLAFHDLGPVQERTQPVRDTSQPLPRGRSFLVPVAVAASIATLTWVGVSGERGFLPILGQLRGLSPSEVGIVMTVLGGATAVFMVPIGRLSDRVGRKRVIMAGVAVGTLALAGYSVAGGLAALLGLAVLRAAATAATQPVVVALLSEVTPNRVRGQVMGMYGSLEDIGIAVGPALVGLVWAATGIGSAFLVMAAVSVAGLVVATFFIRESSWRLRRETLALAIAAEAAKAP